MGQTLELELLGGQSLQAIGEGHFIGGHWIVKENTCPEDIWLNGSPDFKTFPLSVSGGYDIFNFSTKAQGPAGKNCKLEFSYQLPWNPRNSVSKTVNIHLQ